MFQIKYVLGVNCGASNVIQQDSDLEIQTSEKEIPLRSYFFSCHEGNQG